MVNQRLGKRERALLKVAREMGKRQSPISFAGDTTQRWMRSPNGSVNGASALMGATHSNFRGKGAVYGVRTIHHGEVSIGRVEPRSGWAKQAPLPTDHGLLRTLERGDKVAPVEASGLPDKPIYATAPMTKRFGKSK